MLQELKRYREYLEARNRSHIYYNYMRIWLRFCNQNKIDYNNISQENITEFFNGNNYKPETKNLFIKSARNFYRFLKIENDWHTTEYTKVVTKPPEYLTYDDIKKAEKYLITYSTRILPEKAIAIMYIMFFTGIRKIELLLLKRNDFDFQKGEVKIYQKKSKQEIILPLIDDVKKRIEKYFKMESERTNAFNITKTQIDYLFRVKLSDYLGKKVKPHLTRHGAGRYMLEKGIPIKDIQDILGHKNIATTMRYIQHTEEQRNQIYKDKLSGEKNK